MAFLVHLLGVDVLEHAVEFAALTLSDLGGGQIFERLVDCKRMEQRQQHVAVAVRAGDMDTAVEHAVVIIRKQHCKDLAERFDHVPHRVDEVVLLRNVGRVGVNGFAVFLILRFGVNAPGPQIGGNVLVVNGLERNDFGADDGLGQRKIFFLGLDKVDLRFRGVRCGVLDLLNGQRFQELVRRYVFDLFVIIFIGIAIVALVLAFLHLHVDLTGRNEGCVLGHGFRAVFVFRLGHGTLRQAGLFIQHHKAVVRKLIAVFAVVLDDLAPGEGKFRFFAFCVVRCGCIGLCVIRGQLRVVFEDDVAVRVAGEAVNKIFVKSGALLFFGILVLIGQEVRSREVDARSLQNLQHKVDRSRALAKQAEDHVCNAVDKVVGQQVAGDDRLDQLPQTVAGGEVIGKLDLAAEIHHVSFAQRGEDVGQRLLNDIVKVFNALVHLRAVIERCADVAVFVNRSDFSAVFGGMRPVVAFVLKAVGVPGLCLHFGRDKLFAVAVHEFIEERHTGVAVILVIDLVTDKHVDQNARDSVDRFTVVFAGLCRVRTVELGHDLVHDLKDVRVGDHGLFVFAQAFVFRQHVADEFTEHLDEFRRHQGADQRDQHASAAAAVELGKLVRTLGRLALLADGNLGTLGRRLRVHGDSAFGSDACKVEDVKGDVVLGRIRLLVFRQGLPIGVDHAGEHLVEQRFKVKHGVKQRSKIQLDNAGKDGVNDVKHGDDRLDQVLYGKREVGGLLTGVFTRVAEQEVRNVRQHGEDDLQRGLQQTGLFAGTDEQRQDCLKQRIKRVSHQRREAVGHGSAAFVGVRALHDDAGRTAGIETAVRVGRAVRRAIDHLVELFLRHNRDSLVLIAFAVKVERFKDRNNGFAVTVVALDGQLVSDRQAFTGQDQVQHRSDRRKDGLEQVQHFGVCRTEAVVQRNAAVVVGNGLGQPAEAALIAHVRPCHCGTAAVAFKALLGYVVEFLRADAVLRGGRIASRHKEVRLTCQPVCDRRAIAHVAPGGAVCIDGIGGEVDVEVLQQVQQKFDRGIHLAVVADEDGGHHAFTVLVAEDDAHDHINKVVVEDQARNDLAEFVIVRVARGNRGNDVCDPLRVIVRKAGDQIVEHVAEHVEHGRHHGGDELVGVRNGLVCLCFHRRQGVAVVVLVIAVVAERFFKILAEYERR